MRSCCSAAVATFFQTLVAEKPPAIVERTCIWVQHHLLHDARFMSDAVREPVALYPVTGAACFEDVPHRSWADLFPATAGRAYTALCFARFEWQMARAQAWLLEGEAADGPALLQAVLRQDLDAAGQARVMLQCCVRYPEHVEPFVEALREIGKAHLIPHLVDAAADELVQLRQHRERIDAAGWMRSFIRKYVDAAEEKLAAFATLAQ